MFEPNPILPLPTNTTTLLRSNVIITSLPSVLVELVQNSLDSNAKTISISIDLDRWNIKCEDDGTGFEPSGLEKVGQRYFTSKLDENLGMKSIETFGFRGEALASLANLSRLEILTKSRSSEESYSLILKEGVMKYFGVAKTGRNGIGSTVWCRDIFYKWPVRRRPASSATGRLNIINQLKHSLSIIALLHPSIAFSLVDTSSSTQSRLISVSKMREGVLGRWKQLWGRAGVERVVEFDELEGENGEFRANGFFSLTASHSKGSQYIYINSRPVSPSPLHKLINKLFLNSSFARHSSSHLVVSEATTSKSESIATRKSPRKTAERHPIFILNLQAPPGMIDVTLEPEKRVIEFEDEERVHTFVELIVKQFLASQGFIPAVSVSSVSLIVDPPAAVDSQTDSRMDLDRFLAPKVLLDISAHSITIVSKPRVIDRSSEIRIFPENHDTTNTPPEVEVTPISWTDPTTLQSFLIDPRTGNSWRPAERRRRSDERTESDSRAQKNGRSGLVDRSSLKRKTLECGEDEEDESVPDWITASLAKFVNPVFETAPKPIPSLPLSNNSKFTPISKTLNNNSAHRPEQNASLSRHQLSTISTFFGTSNIAGIGPSDQSGTDLKFTKEGLRTAKFIAQVDRKFLLVKMRSSAASLVDGETLVMVDQHAASERIRVEGFLKEMGEKVINGEEVRVKQLDPPALVLISREEGVQLRNELDEFNRWGIEISYPDVINSGEDSDYTQIQLHSVPYIVGDRLGIEKRLQQELIRSHLAQLSSRLARFSMGVPKTKRDWSSIMKDLPPVLLDLINSKSCRGAIMFGDELSEAQCKKLLVQLSETNLPFQCAHGRPSIAPLLSLPSPSETPALARPIDWSRIE